VLVGGVSRSDVVDWPEAVGVVSGVEGANSVRI
jgi:hypothetical protein